VTTACARITREEALPRTPHIVVFKKIFTTRSSESPLVIRAFDRRDRRQSRGEHALCGDVSSTMSRFDRRPTFSRAVLILSWRGDPCMFDFVDARRVAR
jgi:hypothetical protein